LVRTACVLVCRWLGQHRLLGVHILVLVGLRLAWHILEHKLELGQHHILRHRLVVVVEHKLGHMLGLGQRHILGHTLGQP